MKKIFYLGAVTCIVFVGYMIGQTYIPKESTYIAPLAETTPLPLSISQQRTYTENKQAIDTFIQKVDPRFQNWMKGVIIVYLHDLNTYLVSLDRAPLTVSGVDLVDTIDPKAIVLDVRDDYERKFVQLPNVKHIRFGNLLHGQLDNLRKNDEIIVLCYTDARSFIAVNYLKSIGFTNVKGYKGGAIAWIERKNPVMVNKPFRFIFEVLPKLSVAQVQKFQEDATTAELVFKSDDPYAIHSIFMSDQQIEAFIEGLSPQKQYIISCDSNDHCFDAVSFWDKAKDKLHFLGYTGYFPK